MKLFSKKTKTEHAPVMSTGAKTAAHPFFAIERYTPLSTAELDLYSSLREAIPVVDAAIAKLVRLLGSFKVTSDDKRYDAELQYFLENVECIGGNKGIYSFIYSYIDQLLSFGTAVGEMIPKSDRRGLWGLYNASLKDVSVIEGDTPMETLVCLRDSGATPVKNQSLLLSSLLNPDPGTVKGNSVLKGLPFVSSVLLRIFQSIGTNWERAGNIRYAVTYNPGQNPSVNAKKRAEEIANEWSRAMRDDSRVCDFVSVGDVSIKVIGSDSQILDCDVPIKRIMEQIVAKLSIPPFMLGLSWSSTERMSSVQADILTSEIEYYRALLNPIITKVCETHLRLLGSDTRVSIEWNNISLQDETSLSVARLNNARAQQIENTLEANS